ncbi:MAG: ABC transporter permease [Methanobacterium sp.]
MKGLYAATWAESLKFRKSKMPIITLVVFSGIAIMMGLMVFISRYPELAANSAAVSAKASMFNDNWSSYFQLLIQIILSLGTIGFGFVSSWIFGREYTDRVIKDILALPVNRLTIVSSKFIIIFLWSILLSLTLFISGLIAGFIVNIAGWSTEIAIHYFIIFIGTSFLTILISTPVAFIASFSRGYLAPIGYVLATLIITNLVVLGTPVITPYVPWAIPALISGLVGPNLPSPGIISYIALISTCIFGLVSTLLWWRFADQT